MNIRNYRGFMTVATLVMAGAIGLGGLGAAVSFYQSNERFSEMDISAHSDAPQPTPTPTVAFHPIVTEYPRNSDSTDAFPEVK